MPTFKEFCYPQVGTTSYGPIQHLGTDYWQSGGAWVYIPAYDELWMYCHWSWTASNYTQANIIQIVDATTMQVKQYIARTTEPAHIEEEDNMFGAKNVFYDEATDCVYFIAGSGQGTNATYDGRAVYKYSRATKTLVASNIVIPTGTFDGGVYGAMSPQYNHYTGECYVVIGYNHNNSAQNTFGRLNLNTLTLDYSHTCTFSGVSPPSAQVYPGRTVFSQDGRIWMICEPTGGITDHNLAVASAPDLAALPASKNLYEYNPTTHTFTSRATLPAPAYDDEVFFHLLYVEDKNAIYLFSTSAGSGTFIAASDRPERVFRYDLSTGNIAHLWDLPCYDPRIWNGTNYDGTTHYSECFFYHMDWLGAACVESIAYDPYRKTFWMRDVFIPESVHAQDGWVPPTIDNDTVHEWDHNYIVQADPDTGEILFRQPQNSQLLPAGGTAYLIDEGDASEGGFIFTPNFVLCEKAMYMDSPYVSSGLPDWGDEEYFVYGQNPQPTIIQLDMTATTPTPVRRQPVVFINT